MVTNRKEYMRLYMRSYYKTDKGRANVEKALEKYFKKPRRIVIYHYTNGKNCCQCPGCSEDRDEFLTIDHVNNDGLEHRRIVPGTRIFKWLIENNFPPGFQILCWNCNMGKARNNGICPHLKAKSNSL